MDRAAVGVSLRRKLVGVEVFTSLGPVFSCMTVFTFWVAPLGPAVEMLRLMMIISFEVAGCKGVGVKGELSGHNQVLLPLQEDQL